MSKPLPLSDFRAVRYVLEEREYLTGWRGRPAVGFDRPDKRISSEVADHRVQENQPLRRYGFEL